MRIAIRESPAPFHVALASWLLAVLALFVYGLFLPEDWERCFGLLARPIRFAAQMPLIEGFAAVADVPGEIVSGFFGLLFWLPPLVGFHGFLCAYDRESCARAQAERQSPPGPDILHTLRTLGIGCGCLAGVAIPLVVVPFLDPEFLLEDEAWMRLIGDVMLADRFRLALWGGALVLGFFSSFFWLSFLLLAQWWTLLTGKPPWPLQAPDDGKTDEAERSDRVRAAASRDIKARRPGMAGGRAAPAPRRGPTLLHDIGFRNVPRKNRNRVGWGIVAFFVVLAALFATAALPVFRSAFQPCATSCAYLAPALGLCLFWWGGVVRLEDGRIGLVAHWRPPDVHRGREPGLFSRLSGMFGALVLWTVCLSLLLVPPLLSPGWRADIVFSAIRDAFPPDDPVERLVAAALCAIVFFFGVCAFYGLLANPVKCWAHATGKEPSPAQKETLKREGGLWTKDEDGELRRLDGDEPDF